MLTTPLPNPVAAQSGATFCNFFVNCFAERFIYFPNLKNQTNSTARFCDFLLSKAFIVK